MITCPNCGKQNRREAQFCRYCGADLRPTRAMPPAAPGKDKQPRPAEGPISELVRAVKRLVTGVESPPTLRPVPSSPASTHPLPAETPPTLRPAAPPQPSSPPASQMAVPPPPLSVGGKLAGRYSITRVRKLTHSIYYDALDLICPACQTIHVTVPSDGLCTRCSAPLTTVLIHERHSHPGSRLPDTEVRQLLRLSTGHTGILPHRDILRYEKTTYVVVEHPGQWGVLVRGRRQRSPDEALAGAVQVTQTLAYLHDHGFAHSEVGGASIESLVTVGGGTDVKLADLSNCTPLSSGDAQAVRAQINRDVAFLGGLLFYLATGKELSRSNIEFAPPVLRPFIERAMREEYAAVRDMLTDFSLLPSTPTPARSLKPSHGQATHPGKKHTRNEDAVVTFTFDKEQDGRAVPIGFYLVADGMGGHDAGDVASRTVNQIVTDWIIKTKVLPDLRKATRKLTTENVPGELLTQAIQRANEALLRRAQAKGSDLGSTVTAALVIGDVATVASVGDSRTYLLRNGHLEQITQDHSLVARLVDAGVIEPEEVRTHPQRNQIYRCLGHKSTVEVDTFTVQLRRGDRLILCSDGLWEMVVDEEIRRIVEQAHSPQQACDALVEAANQAGGEDNIAVIVVEME